MYTQALNVTLLKYNCNIVILFLNAYRGIIFVDFH